MVLIFSFSQPPSISFSQSVYLNLVFSISLAHAYTYVQQQRLLFHINATSLRWFQNRHTNLEAALHVHMQSSSTAASTELLEHAYTKFCFFEQKAMRNMMRLLGICAMHACMHMLHVSDDIL